MGLQGLLAIVCSSLCLFVSFPWPVAEYLYPFFFECDRMSEEVSFARAFLLLDAAVNERKLGNTRESAQLYIQ
jgi:hypothetical protein